MSSATGGLMRRTVLATCAALVIVGVTFAVLLALIGEQRQTARMARRSQIVFVAADHVDRLAADMQAAQQEYSISGDPAFLADWKSAQARPGRR